ncbi:MAG: toll/interleukin-1 receptor domain-containing protein [Xanthobacteraceae bacterium]
MGYVFISYAREDQATARHIQQALERVGVSVWWDERLQLGREFEPPIVEALKEADAILVLWSPASVQSDWVKREALAGLKRDVLIPVLLAEAHLPQEFARVNGVNLKRWTPGRPSTEFDRLVRRLLQLTRGSAPGEWKAERLAPDTLRVCLDQEDHVVQYTQGRVFIDGQPAGSSANPLDYDRSFDFDLSDGSHRYVCNLVVRVSAFRGSVKHMKLSIGGSVVYDQ